MRVLSLLLLAAALVGLAQGVALSANSVAGLTALISATKGTSWTVQWDPSTFATTFCTSNGGTATCDPWGNVRSLKLTNNNLDGSLPTEIGLLTALTVLYINNNLLTGTIPTELGLCTKIGTMLLNNNFLEGPVPTELGNLVPLGGIHFNNNLLSGSYPSEVALLPNVIQVNSYDNMFTELPPAFGAKTQSIRFENNLLAGGIPAGLFTPTLTNVRLSSNALSGEIPTEIGLATKLQIFHVWENSLSGSIPTELAKSGIQRFWAYTNGLTGEIPTQLAASKSLVDLRVMGNQLTGSLPAAFGSSSLQFLWVSNNQLTGTIPTNILASSTITSLRINLNFISGQLPKEIIGSSQLQNFVAGNTCISPVTDYAHIPSNDFYSFAPNPGCSPAVIGQSPPYPTTALPTVLMYQFATGLGSLADSSPSNNPLSKIGGGTVVSTNIGQAYNPLNGAAVTIPVGGFTFRSAVRVSLSSFSVELLFSTTGVSTVQDLFGFTSSSSTSPPANSIICRVTLDSQFLKLYAGTTLVATSTTALAANRMNHVVLTFSSTLSQARLYLNGAQVALAGSVSLGGTNYFIAARGASVAYDELYVYPTTLIGNEVTSHLNSLQWCLNACPGSCTPTPNGNVCS